MSNPLGRSGGPYGFREDAGSRHPRGVASNLVIDVLFLALVLAGFALVALVAKGVEKL